MPTMDAHQHIPIMAVTSLTGIAAIFIYYFFFKKSEASKPVAGTAATSKKTKADRAAASVAEGDKLYIYFGSQTGTAESFAKELGKQATDKGVPNEVVDMEAFEPEDFIKQKKVVLVLATYGEGDPTDNAVAFNKWVTNKNTPEGCVSGMEFAIMGLGNRQYINFNEMARRADKGLARLGAKGICRRGEGDDDQDVENDFNTWASKDFWPAFLGASKGGQDGDALSDSTKDSTPREKGEKAWIKRAPLEIQIDSNEAKLRSMSISVEATPTNANAMSSKVNIGSDVNARFYFASSAVKVAVDKELRQVPDLAAGLATHHVEFDLSTIPGLTYVTADNLDILPENPSDVVEWFAGRLGIKNLDDYVTFVKRDGVEDPGKRPFPTPCTLREALTLYCDLTTVPPKSILRDMAAFCDNDRERDAVEALMSEDGVRHFRKYIKETEMTFREFIELFVPSAKFDVGAFLQMCPRQRPRPYTISSSSKEFPNQVSVTVSMVMKKLPSLSEAIQAFKDMGRVPSTSTDVMTKLASSERVFKGVCSTFLCSKLKKGMTVRVLVKPSTFRLPTDPKIPVIMVAAGTGLAPFRAFVREFAYEKRKTGNTVLFFGCTDSKKDFIYKDELTAASRTPTVLSHLITAFSREQTTKVYVQHRVKEEGELLVKLIDQGAYFYICGGTAMGRAVGEALAEFCRETGRENVLETLKTEKRLIEELWS